jgi:hypothetical protein
VNKWAGVALPLVRKVFGSLSTKEFMSVQPMNLPSGLVFFLDFQYGDAKQLSFGTGGDVYSTSSMYGIQTLQQEQMLLKVYMVLVDLVIHLIKNPHH